MRGTTPQLRDDTGLTVAHQPCAKGPETRAAPPKTGPRIGESPPGKIPPPAHLARIDRSADEKCIMPPIIADGCFVEPVAAAQKSLPEAATELDQIGLGPNRSFGAHDPYVLDAGQDRRFVEPIELIRHQDTDVSCLVPRGVNMIEFFH